GHHIIDTLPQRGILQLDALTGAIKHRINSLLGDVAEGRFQVKIIFLAQGSDLPPNQTVLLGPEGNDAPLANTQAPVGNDLVEVDFGNSPQAVTLMTGSLRRIEREVVGCRLRIGNPRSGTHQQTAVKPGFPRLKILEHDDSVPLGHGRLHAFPEAMV
ncbi:hypothetical protein EG867_16780, partial [Enterococcus faecalis]